MDPLEEHEFAELVREAYPRLWTLAAAVVGDRHRAEDVVQESVMVGLRRLATYQRGTNFVAWMSQIVRYTALNARKSAQKRKAEPIDGHQLEGGPASEPFAGASGTQSGLLGEDQADFDDQVAEAINALEPLRRACLLLRVLHNQSYGEIAQQLGMPYGTVVSHVHRAKAALRKALSDRLPGGPGDE